jgi:hypothetical protein
MFYIESQTIASGTRSKHVEAYATLEAAQAAANEIVALGFEEAWVVDDRGRRMDPKDAPSN